MSGEWRVASGEWGQKKLAAPARFGTFLCSLLCLLSPLATRHSPLMAQFAEVGQEFQRTNPQFLAAFREASARPSRSTVRVLCDGKETSLGMVVIADGWILTKANDLHGFVSCRLADGRTLDARIVGVHPGHDLALLQIPARGLTPVDFRESKSLAVGSWLICPGPGEELVGVGIVSVPTRTMPAKQMGDSPYLGVSLDENNGIVRITNVVTDSPADRAGLRKNDVILTLHNKGITTSDDFMNLMQQRKVGDTVNLRILRDKDVLHLQATLAVRPRNSRGDVQNHMGSELSSRVTGYATILQHDAVIRPKDCGGPVVDLDGRTVGINICRPGRTETWAIPTEIIQPVLFDLMSGNQTSTIRPPSSVGK
jgi:serine protease Do